MPDNFREAAILAGYDEGDLYTLDSAFGDPTQAGLVVRRHRNGRSVSLVISDHDARTMYRAWSLN